MVKTPISKIPISKIPVSKTPISKTPVGKTPVSKLLDTIGAVEEMRDMVAKHEEALGLILGRLDEFDVRLKALEAGRDVRP